MLDKQELYQKIKEILIYSQFEHWVEPKNGNPTADEVNSRLARAIDYYLGREKDGRLCALPDYEMTKFHTIVCMQASLIMREIQNVNFLEYCKECDDGYTMPA